MDYVQLKSGVVIPAATFAEALSSGKPAVNEIATIDRDVTQTPFANTLTNSDDTLITRGLGKGLKIYDELRRDAQAAAVLDKRELAVVARNWDISPASDSAPDVAAAQLVRENFESLNLDRITRELLDATLKGFAVGEVMWGVEADRVVARDVIPRDQRRFVFDLERKLHMLTRAHLVSGEPMPERKFIVHTVGGKDGSPFGLGVGSRLFWPVFFKRKGIIFWLVFCDKFGSPTAIGKYPVGTGRPDQVKLLAALQAIAQDSGIIVPSGTEIELLEASRSGSIDSYEKLARYMDEQSALAVLGETMTTNAQAGGLGSTQANVHNEVRKELAKADSDLLSDTLNSTLIRWLVDYNLPGAGYPKFYRQFDDEDLDARAIRDAAIYELGFEPTEQYIRETYGEGWFKSKGRTLPSGQPSVPGTAFAEVPAAVAAATADQAALAEAADALAADWERLLGPRIDELLAFVEETGDLVTFRERLAELLQGAPSPALVQSLERAGFAAGLLGRTAGE